MKKIYSLLLALSILFSGTPVFSQENTGAYAHIIINQVYGGGDLYNLGTPVSHSFIELYNPTDETADINGWSVQYSDGGTQWAVFGLSGEIPPRHSYLIRCGAHNPNARLKLTEYDASWSKAFNNKGLKLLLKSDKKPAKSANPYASGEKGYIDMAAVAGNEKTYLIDGCETDYSQIQSKQKSIRRTGFVDTDNNAKDFSAIDYRTADLSEVRPRSLKDGEWSFSEFVRTKNLCKTPLEYKEGDFTFLHVSDTQASTKGQFEKWGELTAALAGVSYDFTIHTGDITDNPNNTAEMDMFYEYSGNLMEKPFIPVVGNHDMKPGSPAKLFEDYFGEMPGTQAPYPVAPNTTASFDYGNAHFVILNSEDDLETQAAWLEQELKNTDKKWKIVAIHRSPYGAAGINDTAVFTYIFDKYGVDLVIHGHDHIYARTYPMFNGKPSESGTIYSEAGSSGIKQESQLVKQSYHSVMTAAQAPSFSLISVKEDGIYITAKALNNGKLEETDSFTIKKTAAFTDEAKPSFSGQPVEYFSDVRADRPYRGAVILLSQLGIIEKTASFLPKAVITADEFHTMLAKASGTAAEQNGKESITLSEAITAILDRLGYGLYIEASGADPRQVANDIGIYSGISLSDGDPLTRGEASRLILNAMEAYIIKNTGISESGTEYGQVYACWLNTVFNVYKMTGIITDRPYYTETSSDKHLTFVNKYGEEISALCSEEAYPLLGYEIDAYIKDPYSAAELLSGVKTEKNNILKVKKSSYGEITRVDDYIHFTYTDSEDKIREVRIRKNARFVYNEGLSEEILKRALSQTKNAFKPSHIGSITLADNDSDGVYDYVFIDNYKDIAVSGINPGDFTVTNKLAYIDGVSEKASKYTEIPKISLNPDSGAYRVSFKTPENNPSSFAAITKDCVISVALSSLEGEDPETARIRRVYVSSLSTVGEVKSVFRMEDDDYFIINGKAYRPSKSYYNTYNGGESIDFSDIKVGTNAVFYLDFDERIAYIEKVKPENGFGLLTARLKNADSLGETALLKLIDANGQEKEYKISKENYLKYGVENVSLPRPLEYRAKDGTITSIDSWLEADGSGLMKFSKPTLRTGNYFIGDTVLFMYSKPKGTDGGDYYLISPGNLEDGTEYEFDIFGVDKYYSPEAAVVYYDSSLPPKDGSGVLLVTEAGTAVNADKETVGKVGGYSGGEYKEFLFTFSQRDFPEKGSVISYRTNPRGEIESWRSEAARDTAEFEKNTVFDKVFYAKYPKLKASDRNILTFDYGGGYANHIINEDTVIYTINKKGGVIVGNAEDSAISGSAFIIAKEGIISEIFVWEDN